MTKRAPKKEQPAKLFADQYEDEEVLYVFRKHPIVMRKGFVIGMLCWLLGPVYVLILTFVYPPESPNYPEMGLFFTSLIAGIAIGILLFMPAWIAWYYSVYIVTDQRLIQITRKGLFHKTVVDMNLSQIQSMNYQVDGLQATLLGFGTIMIQTYMGDLVIHEVHHPEKVQKKIAHILKDQGVTAQILTMDEGEA